MVFDKLWNFEFSNVAAMSATTKNDTKTYAEGDHILKVTGNMSYLGVLTVDKGARVLILSDKNATINVGGTGKFVLGGGILSIQGRDTNARPIFDGKNADRKGNMSNGAIPTLANDGADKENFISIRSGNAYFEYATIQRITSTNSKGTLTRGGAVYICRISDTDGKNNTRQKFVDVYACDLLFDANKASSGAAFSSANVPEGSEVYFYKTVFQNGEAVSGGNNSGAGAVRCGGLGLCTFYKCDFIANKATKGSSGKLTSNDAGGAVRWTGSDFNIQSGTFNSCTFRNNTSKAKGGAIFATGGIQLNACGIYDNISVNALKEHLYLRDLKLLIHRYNNVSLYHGRKI
jgi:predicted outer membrane repeat protein